MLRLQWLFGALLAMAFAVSCGGGGGSGSGGEGGSGGEAAGGGGGGGAGGQGGGEGSGGEGGGLVRDTSAFEGRLTWSRALRFGVLAWDLPSSELIYKRIPDEEDDKLYLYATPTLSSDGSTLAHAVEHTHFMSGNFSQVEIVDLDSGTRLPYTEADLEEFEYRNTSFPSLSGDGRRVAVSEWHAEIFDEGFGEMPTDPSQPSIEVWDRDADKRIRITDGDARDTRPILSADGKRVLFVSDRDTEADDLYIADVVENAEVQRLSVYEGTEIANLDLVIQPGRLAASADLRWVAFVATVEEGSWEYFLLDTSTGDIEHIDLDLGLSDDAIVFRHTIAISADGSTLAYYVQYLDLPDSETLILVAPREDPTAYSVLHSTEMPTVIRAVALSANGSQVAYTRESELWISDKEGSKSALVASEDDDWLGAALVGGMSLSF